MKNRRTHLPGVRIVYRFMIVVMLFITACQPKEKKQRATLPVIDSLQKDTQIKNSSKAKEVFPGGDTIQQECQLIQGQAESLLEEYHRSIITTDRRREILAELKKLELKWKQMDCQQVFGYMIPPASSPTGNGNSTPGNPVLPK